ncbi:hypothetical protein P170DRAFT_396789 [Aspergillus steynii IBT 23096]|uniref:Uncharacterized protein n=1 Tax=Aspergillus steynii IBT 23096 TaxID=1392250 RepID=A0A2I2GLV4_9EURO|nr:uncharacterized protein P170DRAFT_396789 [Aspergillus steynii IBT 23096]PLB53839.1 hypothetical protein P170DRAFT_396789 [Aspergillus steynii IBT 23096]
MVELDDIAIVGYSFKLPQDVDDDLSFWKILQDRRNLMTDWPESRMNGEAFVNSSHSAVHGLGGHFINEDVRAFDAPFFSVTAKEAAAMDPMQRWTLEVSYRAFEKSGIPVETLKASRTAVFSATMIQDYSNMMAMDPENAERTAVTGSVVPCIIPNRISWYFDLRGPSIHVNTACSSSLAAVDMACKTLRSGDASCAIVTGSNLLLDPAVFQMLSAQNFLSPDSKCYSFDHRANGYARGEGILAVVLKPLAAALKAGDTIRAVIRSTGSNQDGRTPVLTQPSSQAQEDLIRHVYRKASLSFEQTRYFEAHGTGTPVGDPIEMRAIGRVFRKSRSLQSPLYVGSVKANIGHLEAASALASVVKAILMLERGVILPNALFEKVNSSMDLDFYNIKARSPDSEYLMVPTENIPWPSPGLRRISVNSFGFGGSNTHIILDDAFHYLQDRGLTALHCTISDRIRSNGVKKALIDGNSRNNGALNGLDSNHTGTSRMVNSKVLVFSAADEKSVKRMVKNYSNFYSKAIADDAVRLERLSFTLAARRSHMLWRGFAIVTSPSDKEGENSLAMAKPIRSSTEIGLAFVFTGQGAQYVDMGCGLIQFPVFADTLKQVDNIYGELGCSWSVFVTDALRHKETIDSPEYSQPLSTAVQIALVELLRSFGIMPKAVVGHSSGEIAAAYSVGALSLFSACKVAYFRGKLARNLINTRLSSTGAMMSVNLAEEQIPEYLEKFEDQTMTSSINTACVNSPNNCTLSGLEQSIDVIKRQMDKDGIFAQKLKTGVAYHSPIMQTIAADYFSLIGKLEGVDRRESKAVAVIPMVSSVTGKAVRSAVLTEAQYWVDNMVLPVRFSDAVQTLTQKSSSLKVGLGNITDLVEVGPHPALRRPVQDTIEQEKNRNKQIRYSSVLHRSQPAIQSTLDLAGRLFCLGYPVTITAVNQQDAEKPQPFLVDCPEYPFDRSQHYWAESRLSRNFRLRGTVKGETLGVRVSDWNPFEPRWRNFLSVESSPWIGHHMISDTVIYPAAGMLVMAIEAVQQMVPEGRTAAGYLVKKAEFTSPIIVSEAWEDRTETQVRLLPVQRQHQNEVVSSSDVAIFACSRGEWAECFRAKIDVDYESLSCVDEGLEKCLSNEAVRKQFRRATQSCKRPVDPRVLYRDANEHGLQYGDWFQLVQDVNWDGKSNAVAHVDVSRARYGSTSFVHPAVLDQAFHVLRVCSGQQPAANVPVILEDAWFSSSGWQHPQTNSISWLATSTTGEKQGFNFGEQGSLQALADNGAVLCTIRKAVTAAVSAVSTDIDQKERRLIYGIEWKPQLSLMDPEQISKMLASGTVAETERILVSNYRKLRFILNITAVHALRAINDAKVPESLKRHVSWMKHHVKKLPLSMRENAEMANIVDVERLLNEVEMLLPTWKLYTTCARSLPDVFAGEIDPLEIVFGSDLADIFYADLFQNLCTDGRLSTILDLASHENPGMRILEVGAGTGGMTGHVLAALQMREKRTGTLSFAEYDYTDISPSFFTRASERWADLQAEGRMKFKTLNLEQAIDSQGFKPGSYDLVIAASVLHATPYLEATIQNVRRALKPGGRLVLLEVVKPDDILTSFMAGLVPGWWLAREDWRSLSPAVSEDLWDQCLRENGFSGNDIVLRDYQADECHITSIIISTALETTAVTGPLLETRRLVILVDQDQSPQQLHLADLIRCHIDPSNLMAISICAFSSEHMKNILPALSKDDTICCVAEVNNRPCLTLLSDESFNALQQLIKFAPNMLWATSSSINSPDFPSYGAVQGFLRSIRAEQPDSQIVTMAIEGETNDNESAGFIAKAFHAAFEFPSSKEVEYIVRDGFLVTGRAVEDIAGNEAIRPLLSQQLKQRPWREREDLKLSARIRGDIDSLCFVQDNLGSEIGPDEIEIEAHFWGLSHRDIRSVLGHWADDNDRLVGDCAGIVIRVGRDCDPSIQLGDHVCMVAPCCMRKYPRAHEDCVIKIPNFLSTGVTIANLLPVMTACHALLEVARLEKGDRVLIHSAASAVGQAAVHLAKAQGADVFVTASSSEEKQILVDVVGIPENHVFSSRHTSFSKGLMRVTRGYGVDVLLNSLAGEDMQYASYKCLAPGGRFVDIGRATSDSNTMLPTGVFAQNVTFSTVDVLELPRRKTAKMLNKAMQLLAEEKIQHCQPLRVFNLSEVGQAFRQFQAGEVIGRVLVRLRPEDVVPQFGHERLIWTFDEHASYLIAGGTGGLGRAIMQWMADRGAKHLIVLSRSGPTSTAAANKIAELTARGVKIFAPKCDVSSEACFRQVLEDCELTMPPIRGCINASMVLQDAIFQDSMTFEQWELTMRSKVQTSWNLHRFLPGDLDFFILCSSLAGVVGQMASANYASGCSFQDALAHYRISQGQEALSLDLGWMRNIGIIAETSTYQRQREGADDMNPIDDTELLALLDLYCDPSHQFAVTPQARGQILFGLRTPADVLRQGRKPPAILERPLFSTFSYITDRGASTNTDRSQAASAAALFYQSNDSTERIQIVLRALAVKLARAMSISPDDVEPSKPLSAYGVDSLMAVELRNWAGRDFGASVAVFDFMGGVSMAHFADLIVAKSSVGKEAD